MHTPEELQQYENGTWTDLEYNRKARENIIPYVLNLFRNNINSVIDLGCGNGSWLVVCTSYGVETVLGVDLYCPDKYLRLSSKEFIRFDVASEELRIGKMFDLAIGIETAEHIEEPYANTYVQNLTSASDIVLFSGAIPGQAGIHHVNCQWLEYWVDKFDQFNYKCIDTRWKWWGEHSNIPPIYKQNVVLFVDKTRLNTDLQYLEEESIYMGSMVHPKFYETVLK